MKLCCKCVWVEVLALTIGRYINCTVIISLRLLGSRSSCQGAAPYKFTGLRGVPSNSKQMSQNRELSISQDGEDGGVLLFFDQQCCESIKSADELHNIETNQWRNSHCPFTPLMFSGWNQRATWHEAGMCNLDLLLVQAALHGNRRSKTKQVMKINANAEVSTAPKASHRP